MDAEDWKAQRERQKKEMRSNMAYLSDEQREAILKAQKALAGTMQSIHDCQDIWMSDIRDMDEALWRLRNTFPEAEDE